MTFDHETGLCLWCEGRFAGHHGGSPQLFCSAACRHRFHSAARRCAERAVATGRLSIATLKGGDTEACTLPVAVRMQLLLQAADPALVAALRARGSMRLTVSIVPDGIIELVALGWLDRRHCLDPTTVGDAIVELASAALDARLQPSS